MGQAVLTCAAAVWAYMTAWFLAALALKDNSLADLAWGPGFCLAAALTLFLKGGFAARQILVSTLVLVWGFRLALHILVRKRGLGEDFRYAQWRLKWGRFFVVRSYIQVFMLQGIFLLVISLPVVRVNSAAQGPLGIIDVVGAAIWLSGFAFETVADRQLAVFKGDRANQGRIMTSGLWRYSRHPNYFGEAAMWWGLFVFALDSPAGWLTVASPVLITVLLVWVSGVPLLERKYRGRTDFEAYARRTSVFVPWFPKSRDR